MWTLAQINRFEEIIDVRSPDEYDTDHIPDAANYPVLDNKQRAEIGKLYKQTSPLEAKKQGAAIVTENVSRHLKNHFCTRGENWHPLVYCWRGGMRSAALTHILRKIGWQAEQLPGGYKAYRKTVIHTLNDVPPKLDFRVLCGCTGTGKSRLLQSLAKRGAQVIDLETLANHRGSVLGAPTEGKQPSQKKFESLLCRKIHELNPRLPVYVEAESRKIGKIQVPNVFLDVIRSAECIHVEVNVAERTRFLVSEYQHFLDNDRLLKNAIRPLGQHVGQHTIENWLNWRDNGGAENLVRSMLQKHYDPFYLRSMDSHFSRYKNAPNLRMDAINTETLNRAAEEIIERNGGVDQAT